MINEDLKNKIVDYIDGLLDEGSEREVEEILESDADANEFYNQLKSLEIDLDAKFSTSDYQAYSKSVDTKIDQLLEKKLKQTSKNKLFGFLTNSFGINSLLGTNVVTAAMFLFVGIFYFSSDNSDLIEFSNQVFQKEIYIFRSSEGDLSEENQIKFILDEMYENKVQRSQGMVGQNKYELSFVGTPIGSENEHCLKVSYSVQNKPTRNFIYCKAEQSSKDCKTEQSSKVYSEI